MLASNPVPTSVNDIALIGFDFGGSGDTHAATIPSSGLFGMFGGGGDVTPAASDKQAGGDDSYDGFSFSFGAVASPQTPSGGQSGSFTMFG